MGYDVGVLLEALDAVAAEGQRARGLVSGGRQGGHAPVVVLRVLVVLGPSAVAQLQGQHDQEDDDYEAGRGAHDHAEERARERQDHRRQGCNRTRGDVSLFFIFCSFTRCARTVSLCM